MRIMRYVALSLLAVGLFACSKGNDKGVILNSSGQHPSGWAVALTGGVHPAKYLAAPGACQECHGKDLKGGVSKVSCFSTSLNGIACHPQGPSGHPANWALPANHGASAKAAAGGINGMVFCEGCHGTDFTGSGNAQKNCIACHKLANPANNAPHGPAPWRGGTLTHTNTDPSNAAACGQCHTHGQNLSVPLLTTYLSGAPGCFNSTLCHDASVGHASDPRQPWALPANHGSAAKADPTTASNGMALCKNCHGADLHGNGAVVSCFSCHSTAPHSPAPWRPSLTNLAARTHTDTNVQNAPTCAGCHLNNQRLTTPVAVTGTPGCFDGTMCHSATGHVNSVATPFPNPVVAWQDPTNHGVKAKAVAGSTSGFSYCKNCHGDGSATYPLFKGGAALFSCTNTIGCHGLLDSAPHPAKPWRGTTAAGSTGHSSTDTSNATICVICHLSGNNSTRVPLASDIVGSTGCFNATMCHGVEGHADTTVFPAPWAAPANHGRFAKNDPALGGINGFSYCQQCHAANFSGGTSGTSCFTCHGGAGPHPDLGSWTLAAGTYTHTTTALGNAGICSGCHTASTPVLSAPYLARFASSPAGSFNGSAPGCFNASLCHGDVTKTTNCDACHSLATTNPFKSMAGSADPANAITGAHTKHLISAAQTTLQLSASIACSECHAVPASPAISATHRNGTVNITFGTLAKTGGLNPTVARDAVSGALVCTNTYCHGGSLPGGLNKNPRWNDTTYLNGNCTACHNYPPTSHATFISGTRAPLPSECQTCHTHVNASGTGFTNVALHINGTIDATGGGAPHLVPNLLHNATVDFTPCLACHANTAGGVYPAASGAPNCQGCHTLADPTVAGNGKGTCKSCHGVSGASPTPTNALTTASLFPNIKRQHPFTSHHGGSPLPTCGTCHAGVTAAGLADGSATQSGSGAGVNHGPNKTMTSGGLQTNIVKIKAGNGITLNATRGAGATCNHAVIATGCGGGGEGTKSW